MQNILFYCSTTITLFFTISKSYKIEFSRFLLLIFLLKKKIGSLPCIARYYLVSQLHKDTFISEKRSMNSGTSVIYNLPANGDKQIDRRTNRTNREAPYQCRCVTDVWFTASERCHDARSSELDLLERLGRIWMRGHSYSFQ